MKKKSSTTDKARRKLCQAALDIAATEGWSGLSVDAMAKRSRVSSTVARKIFPDVYSVLPSIVELVDSGIYVSSDDGSLRDRLFESIMSRFDAMQKNRAGISAIADAAKKDSAMASRMIFAHVRSVDRIMDAAGCGYAGLKRAAFTAALLVVHELMILKWLRDDTPDMARTMAALDDMLGKLCGFFGN